MCRRWISAPVRPPLGRLTSSGHAPVVRTSRYYPHYPHNCMAPHTRATPVRAAAARQLQTRRSATAGQALDAQRDGGPAHEPPLARHRRPHRPVLAAALALGPRGPHLALPLAPSDWRLRGSASHSASVSARIETEACDPTAKTCALWSVSGGSPPRATGMPANRSSTHWGNGTQNWAS